VVLLGQISVKGCDDMQAHGELKDFETPYVVKLFKFMQLAEPEDAFTFVHPNTDARIDNDRFVSQSTR
jgi:type II protein arginine methyltransferase